MAKEARVLSVQSHVVFGYVGNKSATFPLQILGFEVDPINSVQFSNHTGYKHVAGQVLTDLDLDVLVSNLSLNELDSYSHLLTGYVGSVSFLQRIASVVQSLREVNPNLIYVCDPVMGDNGKMYVPKELLPIYKEVILPLADVLTPNQYEVELLTDRKISNVDEAWDAIDVLHQKGCKIVFISSSELGDETTLLGLGSKKIGDKHEKVQIKIPRLQATFTGTGDLFAALILAWLYRTDNNIKVSLEKTVATLQAVVRKTLDYGRSKGISAKNMELKLIQSKSDIEAPQVVISAQEI